MVRLRDTMKTVNRPTITQFQFLYGSIESKLGGVEASEYAYFNSCMVRLRDEVANYSLNRFNIFQFLYGSIERLIIHVFNNYFIEFQFLYGSIESEVGGKDKDLLLPFQFLYGSIERKTEEEKRVKFYYFNLNSCMIRLT